MDGSACTVPRRMRRWPGLGVGGNVQSRGRGRAGAVRRRRIRAVSWYERLGFRKEWEHQFEPGFPWFVSVARSRARLYLSEHKGDARPNTLFHLYVDDIDAVSREFGVPVDEDGLAGRECDFDDPDGNRLRVAARRS